MIRLPPSVISMTPGDVKDYYRRRWQKRQTARMDQHRAAVAAASDAGHDTPSGNRPGIPEHPGKSSPEFLRCTRVLGIVKSADVDTSSNHLTTASSTTLQTDLPDIEARLFPYRYRAVSSSSSSEAVVQTPQDTESNGEYEVRSSAQRPVGSPENEVHSPTQRLSSTKDSFYYEGFVESLEDQSSASLNPEDASTPRRLLPGLLQIPESREPLPRSPLYMSQNVSSTPERNRSSSLTPRNNPPSPNPNIPSILFSQPPRRPPTRPHQPTPGRPPRRLFRHQTNDFSAESDERANAVYEQARLASNSSTASRPDLVPIRTLRDELRGSSLGSSRIPSASSSETSETDKRDLTHPSEHEGLPQDRILSYGLSPRSELPPPFSSVARAVSGNGPPALPSHEFIGLSATSVGAQDTGDFETQDIPIFDGAGSEPPSSGRGSLSLSPRHLLEFYNRTRSPVSHHGSLEHPSPSVASTASESGQRGYRPSRTPSGSIQVYDDLLPPSSQPQTPAHLPEARHQARHHPTFFNPSYTAPVPRSRSARTAWAIQGWGNGTGRGAPFNTRTIDRSHSRPSRQEGDGPLNRPLSPTGMQRQGFRGLYGGLENGDDESNYLAGVRFDGAPRRLWDVGRSGIGGG